MPPSAYDAPTEQQFLNGETLQLGKFLMAIRFVEREPYAGMKEHWFEEEYSAWLEPRKK
jgi:hypothetical protein